VFAGPRYEIMPVAVARVVTVGVRDHRPLDGAPRVDVKVAGGAIKACGFERDQVHEWIP
jgi:hypothetical protein